jgi:alpha-tubulin suppressor-like RCC1 family protein
MSHLRVMGQNEYGSLGVQVQDSTDRMFKLQQLANKKLLSIGVGDHHTLVVASGCNHVDVLKGDADKCKGVLKCNGGPDVFAWGLNKHGQVNGECGSVDQVETPSLI